MVSKRENDVHEVSVSIVQTLLHDGTWKTIGYPMPPKIGAFFDRFRRQWRVRLEQRIRVEVFALLGAIYVQGGKLTISDIDDVVMELAKVIAPIIGAPSPKDAFVTLTIRTAAYAENAPSEWPFLLATGLDIESVHNRQIQASLMVGVARLPTVLQPMIASLRQKYGPVPS